MAEQTVTSRPGEKTAPGKEITRSRQHYIIPPVDIYEDQDALVVTADLPGVAKEDLDVGVENNTLTIRGTANHASGGESTYREYELANFFRQFELSDKVDQSKITAELKHGVLRLHLPKAEEAKPKRIDVKVA